MSEEKSIEELLKHCCQCRPDKCAKHGHSKDATILCYECGKKSGSAFPSVTDCFEEGIINLRDLFAAKALEAILKTLKPEIWNTEDENNHAVQYLDMQAEDTEGELKTLFAETAAEEAYRFADAMMRARKDE